MQRIADRSVGRYKINSMIIKKRLRFAVSIRKCHLSLGFGYLVQVYQRHFEL